MRQSALSDYFEGNIQDKDGKVLSEITGSFLSHIDFDGKRYWDIRRNIDIEEYPVKNQLKSSSIYRKDSLLLYQKKLDEAQDAKTELEEIQRRDRRLRKAWKEYGSVESVKNEKKKVEEKKDTSNLYGEDKDEEAPEDKGEKTQVLRAAPKTNKEEEIKKENKKEVEQETDDDTPEEEKLEE